MANSCFPPCFFSQERANRNGCDRQFFLDSHTFYHETDLVPATAYLSLGSNLGDRVANLRAALVPLAAAGRLLTVSAFYETQPVEVLNQPWFLNCVAALETEKTPRE